LCEAEQLFLSHDLYFGHGTTSAWDESVFLLSHAFRLGSDPKSDVLNQEVSIDQAEGFRKLCNRRVNERIPASYLTSTAWFCGLEFFVDTRVIIPRSPISELIFHRFSPWLTDQPNALLDMCTGSGCIGIACAYEFDEASVTISDICGEALEVARRNVEAHSLLNRIEIVKSDCFNDLLGKKFDLIVCNPPYVDSQEFAAMPNEYRHEPVQAMLSGEDGLRFTRQLLREAIDHLNPKGILVVEVGNSALALEQEFAHVPFIWPSVGVGDSGVFILSHDQLGENGHFFS
tara:strand:- start:409 stop:1272 length:864 start_codon:yes stop_codon:yes gene_type:complete